MWNPQNTRCGLRVLRNLCDCDGGSIARGHDGAAQRPPKSGFSRAQQSCCSGARLSPREFNPTAIVAPLARIASGVGIGPYAVIGEDAHVGAGTQIGAHSVIGAGCWIGENWRIHPRVTLYGGARLAIAWRYIRAR